MESIDWIDVNAGMWGLQTEISREPSDIPLSLKRFSPQQLSNFVNMKWKKWAVLQMDIQHMKQLWEIKFRISLVFVWICWKKEEKEDNRVLFDVLRLMIGGMLTYQL